MVSENRRNMWINFNSYLILIYWDMKNGRYRADHTLKTLFSFFCYLCLKLQHAKIE